MLRIRTLSRLTYMHAPIRLSNEELATLRHGEPLRLQVEGDQEVVLVLAEQYDRLKQFVDFADTDPRTFYPIIADVNPGDWEDVSAYPMAETL